MTLLRNLVLSLHLSLLLALLGSPVAHGEDESPLTRLFDTGMPSNGAGAITEASLATRTGWQLVPEDTTNHQFTGDAVLLNDKLAVVLRKGAFGGETYSKSASAWKQRASVGYLSSNLVPNAGIIGRKIMENGSSAVMVEATFNASAGNTLRFRLTTGEPLLEIRSEQSAGYARVESSARYVVVPDYFGDDIIWAPDQTHERALPAENFCLSLLADGDSILMNVWQSNQQEAWLAASKAGKDGELSSMRVQTAPGKSIWLAFLETPGIWHAADPSGGKDWKPPFPAKWRKSLARPNGLADSRDLEWVSPLSEGSVTSSDKQTSLAGSPRSARSGPEILYPIDRTTLTPLTVTCPTDVMRNTLGVGPCQYILACENLGAQGDPTPNSVMNWVEKQFEQKKDRKTADEIKERLGVMVQHVADARAHIERYAGLQVRMRNQFARQPGFDPMLSILDDLGRFATNGLARPATPESAKEMASRVEGLIGKLDALTTCRALGAQLRQIGAIQDGALARCRMAVRRLRQEARTIAAAQPQEAAFAHRVQQMAEQFLQK